MPNQPQSNYRRAIVTYLDILGFREIVSSKSASEIAQILVTLKEISSDGNDAETVLEPGDAGSIAFSDAVVRVCPVDAGHKTGAVYHELNSLAFAQAALAEEGVFLRGGVTIGDISFDPAARFIFGPALVRAYDLESNFAIYPRIVIDPSLIAAHSQEIALRGDGHTVEQDWKYVSEVIAKADDQLYFIDYLRVAMDAVESGDLPSPDYLLHHRERVISAASLLKGFYNAKQKYYWLSNYHNATAKKILKGKKREVCLIKTDDLGQ